MEYLANPIILALVKVTALLLLTLSVSHLIKKPAARAILLTCSIVASPVVFALSFTQPLIDIIPADTITVIDSTPKIISSELQYQQVDDISVVTATQAKPKLNIFFILFATGTIITLAPLVISIWKILHLKKEPASGKPLEIWTDISGQTQKNYKLLFIP